MNHSRNLRRIASNGNYVRIVLKKSMCRFEAPEVQNIFPRRRPFENPACGEAICENRIPNSTYGSPSSEFFNTIGRSRRLRDEPPLLRLFTTYGARHFARATSGPCFPSGMPLRFWVRAV